MGTRPDARALRDKYARLLLLRREREAWQGRGLLVPPAAEGRARRAAMQQLARAFPGALRELNALTAVQLEKRLAQIDDVIRRGTAAPPWLVLQLDYHAALREALAVKACIARHGGHSRANQPALEGLRAEVLASLNESGHRWTPLDRIDLAFVRATLSPPGGKLSVLACERVAQRHGVSVAEVRRLVTGRP